jgi:hypothetical protein
MSGNFRSKLIQPRSIQVLPQFHNANQFYMKHSGLQEVVASGTERVRVAERARRKRLNQTTMGATYDTSSITWALGISVGLFLLVTLLRNR